MTQKVPPIHLYQLDVLNFIKKIPDNSIDLLLSDPPYNLQRRGALKKVKVREGKIIRYDVKLKGLSDWDPWPSDRAFLRWYYAWLKALQPKLKRSCHVVLFINNRYISFIRYFLERRGFRMKNVMYWMKSNVLPKPKDAVNFNSSVEEVLWMVRGRPHFRRGKGRDDNFIITQVLLGRERTIHPTQKPIKVIRWLIEHFAKPGTIVCDPFCGSGTTLVVCRAYGLECYGNDKSKEYVKLTKQRVQHTVYSPGVLARLARGGKHGKQ